MKSFIQICGMTQKELKKYLKEYLNGKHYKVIDEDGFLFAQPKGEGIVPVLLVAHLDTVHKEKIKSVSKIPTVEKDGTVQTHISSPEGIGGDDRCGVYMIMNIIKDHKVSVLFCEDEEIGRVGARKFIETEYLKEIDIKYMIELDRRGKNDAVFYNCDNKEFTKWIETETEYKKAWGSYTDITTLMPALKVAGVNFSCGYYQEHTLNEYVIEEQMLNTQEMVCKLLEKEIPKKFEYIENVYNYYGGSYGGSYRSFGSISNTTNQGSTNMKLKSDDQYKNQEYHTKPKRIMKNIINDTQIELVVEVDEEDYGLSELIVSADTKPECWMKLFMRYKYLSYNDVQDYYYR